MRKTSWSGYRWQERGLFAYDAHAFVSLATPHTTRDSTYHSLPYHSVVFSMRFPTFLLSFLLTSALRQTIRPLLSLSHTIPFNPLLGTFLARSPSLLSPLFCSSFSSNTARGILWIPHSRFQLSTTFSLYRVLVRAHHESRGSIRIITFFSRFSRTWRGLAVNDVNITTVRFHGGHLFGIRESRNGKRTRVYSATTFIHVPPLFYVYTVHLTTNTQQRESRARETLARTHTSTTWPC